MTNSLWLVKLARICVIAYSAEFLKKKKKDSYYSLLNVCIVYFANSFLYFCCCFFFLFMFAGIFAFFHLDDQRLSMAK